MAREIKLKYLCTSFSTSITQQDVFETGDYSVYGASGFVGYLNIFNCDSPYLGIIKDGAGVGRINKYKEKTSLLGTMAYIIPNNGVNIDWLKYVIEALDLGKDIGKTTIPHIYFSNYGNRKVYFVDLEQQNKIASFLDQKCTEIDAVIEKTKATIEEYKKLKQSVITEAVTKGIRGNRPMKDSGIEWIGEIPVGWETYRFKNIFSFGKGLPITKENLTETGLSVISYGQIHSKTNTGTNIGQDLIRFVSEEYLQTNKSSLVDKDDFIFADTSEDLDGCGNCVYVDKTMTLFAGYHTIVAFSNRENDNKYLAYLFKSDEWRSQIRSRVSGVKLFSISKKILANTTLILPPLKEEKEISDYLDQKCAEIDTLIAKKTTLLSELETYKKSLIYEYVTGKKEVGEDTASTQVAVYSPYFPITINSQKLFWVKMVLMAKTLEKFNYHSTRVKLQKTIFVLQNSIGFDLDNEYMREKYGPLDNSIFKCENAIKKRGWIKVTDKNGATYYKAGENKEAYQKDYDRYFAEYDTEIDRIINIFKDYDAKKSERIATLFGAWNDAIIDKRQFTDEDIVEDVRNNWHEHKKEYKREEWLEDLEEMKKINLIPKGYGKKTVIKND